MTDQYIAAQQNWRAARHTKQPGPTRQERAARNPGTANSKRPEAPQRLGRDSSRARPHGGPKRRGSGTPSSPARRGRNAQPGTQAQQTATGPTRHGRYSKRPNPPRAIQQEARSAAALRAPACVSSQVELDVAAGDGLDQLARVVLDRVVEQLVRRVGLDELALLHDDDVVGDLADDRQVVRDEQV